MPCLEEGRGHKTEAETEGERGGSNGLQDKPTFLKTPRVVITGAKQLTLHTVANMASLSSLCKKKKKKTLSGYLSDESHQSKLSLLMANEQHLHLY